MWRFVWACIFMYATAVYLCSLYHFGVSAPLIDLSRQGEDLAGEYKVIGYSDYQCAQVCRSIAQIKSLRTGESYRLKWYSPLIKPQLRYGEIWFLQGRYAFPQGFKNSGVANPQWRYSSSGLFGDLKSKGNCCYRIKEAQGFAAFKNSLRQLIIEQTPEHVRGIVLALVLGDKSALIAPVRESFAYFGLSHMLAVSGMHIGIAAGLGYFIAGLVWRFFTSFSFAHSLNTSRFVLEFLCCGLIALTYALLTGFSPSAQRALIMLFVMMGSRIMYGETKWFLAYQVAFVAVIGMSPFAGADAGFWLSFIAVGLLILLNANQIDIDDGWSKVKALVKSQLLLTAGLFFLTVRWQGALSLLSIPLNLVLVPLLGICIMPAIFISLIFIFIGFEWPYHWVVNLLEQATLGLMYLSSLKPLTFQLPTSSLFLLLCAGLVLMFARASLRALLLPYSVLAVVWYCLVPQLSMPVLGEFDIHVMDAGQGTSVVIQTKYHSVLYDTGPSWGHDFSVLEYNLQHYFRLKGIDAFDLVVVSHEDSDHAGGLSFLFQQNMVSELITSFPFSASVSTSAHTKTSLCDRRRSWWLDGVLFELLPSYPSQSSNDRSCILKVSNQSVSILLPGDIALEVEHYWVSHAPDFLEADILIAPHHGSKTSSSTGFINKVNPELVVFTASLPSRFNHPHPEVVGRYLVRGVKIYQTGESGVLRISSEERRTKHIFLD